MDETPDEARGPDEDRRDQENDPTARAPLDPQPPPPDEDDDDDEVDARPRAASRRGIRSGRRLAAAAVAVVVLAGGGAALALNGGDGDQDDDDTAASSTEDPSAGESDWEKVVPGGDCQCFDGSEFHFWVHDGSPDKVVLYLEPGGGCWSAETCARDNAGEVYAGALEGRSPGSEGVFDFADERNPFADYSVVYVPYCTADAHLGNATTEYSADLTIQHKGAVNGAAALAYLATTYPDASEVVVLGESAGSMAGPVYGGLVADQLPEAKVTVLANGSASYPDDAAVYSLVANAWGLLDALPDWPEFAGLTAEEWSLPELFVASGHHAPDVVLARMDFAYDDNQAGWHQIADLPLGDLLSSIDDNEAMIEAAGVQLHSYTAPGTRHIALTGTNFYTIQTQDELLVDWVTTLISGEPVDDVHCDDCETG